MFIVTICAHCSERERISLKENKKYMYSSAIQKQRIFDINIFLFSYGLSGNTVLIILLPDFDT